MSVAAPPACLFGWGKVFIVRLTKGLDLSPTAADHRGQGWGFWFQWGLWLCPLRVLLPWCRTAGPAVMPLFSFPFVWIGWAWMATLFLLTIFPWSVRTRYDLLATGSRTWAGLHLVILSLTCHSKIGSQWLSLSSSLAPLLYPLTILCLSPLAAAISSKSGVCTSSASSSCGEQWEQSLSRALEIRVWGSSPL